MTLTVVVATVLTVAGLVLGIAAFMHVEFRTPATKRARYKARGSLTQRLGDTMCRSIAPGASSTTTRWVGRAALATLPVAMAAPVGLPAVLLGCWVGSVRQRRQAGRLHESEIRASLGEVIDLFAVALNGGRNVHEATREVTRWTTGVVGAALRDTCHRVDRGARLSTALEELPRRLGEPVRPLVAALLSNERYGAPVGPTLAMLAADARDVRRRQAEAAARRLPVTLLFPLVVCVLPAFLLLTVVPVMADALQSFEF